MRISDWSSDVCSSDLDWFKFGKPVASRIVDRHVRSESYTPGQVFALVRWVANDHGTIRSSLDIVRAVGRGEAYTTLAQVDPGGDILLAVSVWPKVAQVFRQIDAIAIGRASCRERGCQYVSISVVAVSLKKQKQTQKYRHKQ